MDKIRIAIDASRNRSGGGRIHIKSILKEFNYKKFHNVEVHVWSYPDLIEQIGDYPWLIKHKTFEKNVSLLKEVLWQRYTFNKLLKKHEIDILLNTLATSVCPFQPSISMSREMCCYEGNVMKKAGFNRQRMRLFLLKYIQNFRLKNSTGALFLTNYAANVIQKFTGKIKNYRIVNHGISEIFRGKSLKAISSSKQIKCVYVSPINWYKNHDTLIRAFIKLNDNNIKLTMVGGLEAGKPAVNAKKRIDRILKKFENNKVSQNISLTGHISHDEMVDILNNSDICVFASSCENMPNTLVEAMSVGLPILCSHRGPMPEVLEDGGVYFDPEDLESTVDGLKSMIYDKNAQKISSQKSYELAKKYSWERCSNETFDFLLDTLNDYKLTNN